MKYFIMVSVWGEDYIIVYLCNAGILNDIPVTPERRFYKLFSKFRIFKNTPPEFNYSNCTLVRIKRVYPGESVF